MHYDLSSFITDKQADKLALSLINDETTITGAQVPLHRKENSSGSVWYCTMIRQELLRQKMEMEASRDYLTGAYTRFPERKGRFALCR